MNLGFCHPLVASDLQMLHQLLQGHLCYEADVQGTWNWLVGLGLKLLPYFMKVKFLVPKMQGFAVSLLTK